MNPYASPNAYRENAVMTASPAQLVVMLYDGAARFLKQAEVVGSESAWGDAGERMTRADRIIDELLVTLDMEQGGEIATQLQAIYIFCKRLLIEARLEKDVEKIKQTAKLLGELRESWAQLAGTV
jgi:flagellar protein FliS